MQPSGPERLESTGPYTPKAPTTRPVATSGEDSRPEIEAVRLNDRYEIVQELARGGMGVVYRGKDHLFGRGIAVKTLRRKFAGESAYVSRFLREAKITGQLQHPGIPPCHDIGRLPDGRPYLIIKLVLGQTLTDYLASVPRAWLSKAPKSSRHSAGSQPGNLLHLLGLFQRV
jgi:serine/threonine protein kinase